MDPDHGHAQRVSPDAFLHPEAVPVVTGLGDKEETLVGSEGGASDTVGTIGQD